MTSRALLAAVVALALLAAPAGAAVQPVDIRANLRLLPGSGAVLVQRGSFAGAPLGRGTVSLRTRIGRGDGATFTFVMATSRGRVQGRGNVALSFRGTTIVYRGRADIVSATGAYARLRARGLTVAGSGPISGETFAVRITGRASS